MSWACVGSWIFPALISVSAIRPPWAGRASHESRAQSQAGMSRCHAGHAGGHRWPTVTTITARCLYITSNNQDPDNSFRQLKRVKLDNLLNVKMTQLRTWTQVSYPVAVLLTFKSHLMVSLKCESLLIPTICIYQPISTVTIIFADCSAMDNLLNSNLISKYFISQQ